MVDLEQNIMKQTEHLAVGEESLVTRSELVGIVINRCSSEACT